MARWICALAVVCSLSVAGADPFEHRTGTPATTESTPCPPPVVIVQPAPAQPRSNAKLWAIGGVALWAASFGINVYAVHDYNSVMPAKTNTAIAEADRDRNIARYAGTSLFAGGAVALGIAGYLYFRHDHTESSTHAIVTPSVSPDHVGLALSAGF